MCRFRPGRCQRLRASAGAVRRGYRQVRIRPALAVPLPPRRDDTFVPAAAAKDPSRPQPFIKLVRQGADEAPGAGQVWANAAWWHAAHPARTRQPRMVSLRAAQPPVTCTLSAYTDRRCRCQPLIVEAPSRRERRGAEWHFRAPYDRRKIPPPTAPSGDAPTTDRSVACWHRNAYRQGGRNGCREARPLRGRRHPQRVAITPPTFPLAVAPPERRARRARWVWGGEISGQGAITAREKPRGRPRRTPCTQSCWNSSPLSGLRTC